MLGARCWVCGDERIGNGPLALSQSVHWPLENSEMFSTPPSLKASFSRLCQGEAHDLGLCPGTCRHTPGPGGTRPPVPALPPPIHLL